MKNLGIAACVAALLLSADSTADDSKIDAYFMLFYMAGAIQFDLRHPADAHDPIADLPSAIRAMITGLRLLKNEQPDVEQPLLEQLAEIDESGGLDGFVDSLRRRADHRFMVIDWRQDE